MKHVVLYSGGLGSWGAALRVVAKHGKEDVVLLFTDTLSEDPDLYRFLDDTSAYLDVPVTKIAEGRDIWQVFNDTRYLGNSRIDPCSRVLKREMRAKWMKVNCDPADTILYVGIDWSESHRYEKFRKMCEPWKVLAPMCDAPYLTSNDHIARLKEIGIRTPRAYELGFTHNNCFNGCVKAGQTHWANLLEKMPERYAYNEQKEQELFAHLGKEVPFLRKTINGKKLYISLKTFREMIQNGQEDIPKFDFGGCGCFVGQDDETEEELVNS
jgi:hypothetical protein